MSLEGLLISFYARKSTQNKKFAALLTINLHSISIYHFYSDFLPPAVLEFGLLVAVCFYDDFGFVSTLPVFVTVELKPLNRCLLSFVATCFTCVTLLKIFLLWHNYYIIFSLSLFISLILYRKEDISIYVQFITFSSSSSSCWSTSLHSFKS